jgi:hypothetical protein
MSTENIAGSNTITCYICFNTWRSMEKLAGLLDVVSSVNLSKCASLLYFSSATFFFLLGAAAVVNGHASADSLCTPCPVDPIQGYSFSTRSWRHWLVEKPYQAHLPNALPLHPLLPPRSSIHNGTTQSLQAVHARQLHNGNERSSYTTPSPT